MSRIVIVGGGERGRVVADYCDRMHLDVLGFLDDTKAKDERVNGLPVLGALDLFESADFDTDVSFHVAIGDSHARSAIYRRLQDSGRKLASIIHPLTDISPTVVLGEGVFIAPNTCIAVNCKIGDFVSIGTHVGIAPDVHIATGASISGGSILPRAVAVGAYTFIGVSTTVVPERNIGSDCVIGAGSLVTKDIPDKATAYGSPCRVVSDNP